MTRTSSSGTRRAVAVVLAAERQLGREPEEMPHSNPGYDVRWLNDDGHWVFVEVKGRVLGAEDFSMTRNEALYAKNAARYRLAPFSVHPEGSDRDEVRYVSEPFRGFEFGDFAAEGVRRRLDGDVVPRHRARMIATATGRRNDLPGRWTIHERS